eukprot:9374477-Karenia_brevis.AAC.1
MVSAVVDNCAAGGLLIMCCNAFVRLFDTFLEVVVDAGRVAGFHMSGPQGELEAINLHIDPELSSSERIASLAQVRRALHYSATC